MQIRGQLHELRFGQILRCAADKQAVTVCRDAVAAQKIERGEPIALRGQLRREALRQRLFTMAGQKADGRCLLRRNGTDRCAECAFGTEADSAVFVRAPDVDLAIADIFAFLSADGDQAVLIDRSACIL